MTGAAGNGAEGVVEALARALGVEVAARVGARGGPRAGAAGVAAGPAPAAGLDRALRPSVEHGRLTVDVPVQLWHASVLSAHDALGFDFFDWLSAVDEQAAGLDVLVHLWSLRDRTALLLRTRVAPDDPRLPSVADVFPGADWYERETYEMFGVVFDGHPRLERLLLPDSVRGHPLRKDVLLASRVDTPWPGTKEPGGESRRRPVLPPGVPEPGGARRAGGGPA